MLHSLDDEDFKDSLDPLVFELMEVLKRREPTVKLVIESLCQILLGAIGQLPPERRAAVRDFFSKEIDLLEDPESVPVDVTDRLQTTQTH